MLLEMNALQPNGWLYHVSYRPGDRKSERWKRRDKALDRRIGMLLDRVGRPADWKPEPDPRHCPANDRE